MSYACRRSSLCVTLIPAIPNFLYVRSLFLSVSLLQSMALSESQPGLTVSALVRAHIAGAEVRTRRLQVEKPPHEPPASFTRGYRRCCSSWLDPQQPLEKRLSSMMEKAAAKAAGGSMVRLGAGSRPGSRAARCVAPASSAWKLTRFRRSLQRTEQRAAAESSKNLHEAKVASSRARRGQPGGGRIVLNFNQSTCISVMRMGGPTAAISAGRERSLHWSF